MFAEHRKLSLVRISNPLRDRQSETVAFDHSAGRVGQVEAVKYTGKVDGDMPMPSLRTTIFAWPKTLLSGTLMFPGIGNTPAQCPSKFR